MRTLNALLIRRSSTKVGSFNVPPLQSHTYSKRRLSNVQETANRGSHRLLPLFPALPPIKPKQTPTLPNADEPIPFSPSLCCSSLKLTAILDFQDLPPLPDPRSKRFHDQFINKCEYCCQMCNFDNPEADILAKTFKEQALSDIHEKMKMLDGRGLEEEEMKSVLHLIHVHLFREFSLVHKGQLLQNDWTNIPELSWPHLSIIYQILFVALRVCGQSPLFGANIIDMILKAMNSPCEVEQDQIFSFMKAYLEELPKYNEPLMWRFKSMLDRSRESSDLPFFMKTMLKIMHTILENSEKHLKIFDVIFSNYLLQLLSSQYLPKFHTPLSRIFEYFAEHKRSNSSKIVRYLLTHYPVVQNEKQVVYLRMMNTFLPKVIPKDMELFVSRAFTIYASALRSHNSNLAEQAMQIWGSARADRMVSLYSKLIIPIVLPALVYASKTHWSQQIRETAIECIDMMIKSDRRYVEALRADAPLNRPPIDPRVGDWIMVARAAADHDEDIDFLEYAEKITQNYE